jgi:hypothetical protein
MTPEELAMAEQARAAAEKRRQRILARGQDRLGLVTGTVSSLPLAENGQHEEQDPPDAELGMPPDQPVLVETVVTEQQDAENEETVTTDTSTKSTSLSKMAAARRKRFASKKNEAPETVTATVTTETSEVTPPEPVADPAPPPVENQEEESTAPVEKKKYMGVAAAQRRKLKAKQEMAGDDALDSSTTLLPPPPLVLKKVLRKKKPLYETMPIIMHVFVIWLLFLAGFEIGWQQRQAYDQVHFVHTAAPTASPTSTTAARTIKVHGSLAPQSEGLKVVQLAATVPQVLSRNLQGLLALVSGKPPAPLDSSNTTTTAETVVKDENETVVKPVGVDPVSSTPLNSGKLAATTGQIDPIFGVDLDLYIHGPGIIMMAARLAVRVHRWNLYFFYYLPQNIVKMIWNTIITLLEHPPIMCLVAITIRQLVGHTLLGAKLPQITEEEGVLNKSTPDVFGMVKNLVTSTLVALFPTSVSLYDAWTHLRADMYIVLCGFFVALALHHTHDHVPDSVWNTALLKPILGSMSDEL